MTRRLKYSLLVVTPIVLSAVLIYKNPEWFADKNAPISAQGKMHAAQEEGRDEAVDDVTGGFHPHVGYEGEEEPGSTSSSYKDKGWENVKVFRSGGKSASAKENEAWKKAPSLSNKELASVQKFFDVAFQFLGKTHRPQELLKVLEQERLSPVATQDFNEYTGKMVIVRTDETLEGTRFFHAQFFEDENKRAFLQHLSFEIRPSPDCVSQAVSMIEQKIGSKIKPTQAPSADYARYQAPNGYIVWVKRLDEEDLDFSPFNARDPVNDVGTCRVAMEKDIHPHEAH